MTTHKMIGHKPNTLRRKPKKFKYMHGEVSSSQLIRELNAGVELFWKNRKQNGGGFDFGIRAKRA